MVGRLNEHNKLEILGMGRTESVGVTRGVVTHITPTVEAIKKVIAIAEDQAKCTIGEVNVGIAANISEAYSIEVLECEVRLTKKLPRKT